MPQTTLFPLNAEPFKPAQNRKRPGLWLKRLLILSELDSAPSSIIRDIPFRRGLNIIKTKQMKTQGGPVAGHSVGKTLLMRMIRYSLGEPTFGSEETQRSLAEAEGLGSAFVVAQWYVEDTDWTVIRPLGSGRADESYCVATSNWHDAVSSEEKLLELVNESVLADLPEFRLIAECRDD